MIIEEQTVQSESTSPFARKTKKIVLCRCDQCDVDFIGKAALIQLQQRKHHFCSRQCESRSRRHDVGVAYEFQLSRRDSQAWHVKVTKTFNERFGGHPFANNSVQEKARMTMKRRYGVTCILALPEIHALCHSPELALQRSETMKRNGTYARSRPEDDFYDLLMSHFGSDNVMRQHCVHKWPIDFYVKSNDVYVQFDGVYWHGLDRLIEVIAKHKTKRDVQIHKKWLTDREQDAWFASHNLRLIRITDKEFQADPLACLLRIERHVDQVG